MSKIIELLAGIAVLFMGLLPFLTRIEVVAEKFVIIKEPGTLAYQAVLIIIGILLVLYAIRNNKK